MILNEIDFLFINGRWWEHFFSALFFSSGFCLLFEHELFVPVPIVIVVSLLSTFATYFLYLSLPIRDESKPKLFCLTLTASLLSCAYSVDNGSFQFLYCIFAWACFLLQFVVISYGSNRYLHSYPAHHLSFLIESENFFAIFWHPSVSELLLATGISSFALLFNPNISFLCCVGTILVIEWRHLFTTRCHSAEELPLDRFFLAALARQSNGVALLDYKTQFNIHQLVVPPHLENWKFTGDIDQCTQELAELRWKACSVSTLPCFMRCYGFFLGLNTPPCCQKNMATMLAALHSSLREMDITHFIDGGTLLGAVRENGQLIPWDDDVDVGYVAPADDFAPSPENPLLLELKQRMERLGYFVCISDGGYFHVLHTKPCPPPFTNEVLRHNPSQAIHLDLIVFRRTLQPAGPQARVRINQEAYAEQMALPENKRGSWLWRDNLNGKILERFYVPEKAVLPTKSGTLCGVEVTLPHNPELYLTHLYGDYKQVSYTYLPLDYVAERRKEVDTIFLQKYRSNQL